MGVGMRIESVTNTADGLEIAYAEESDIDYQAGVIESRLMRVAHGVVDQDLMEQLVDAIVQILEAARVHRYRVADKFQAPR